MSAEVGLSLLGAAHHAAQRVGEALRPPDWLESVAALPFADRAEWDCVIVEVRLGDVPPRADIMAAVSGPPAGAPAPAPGWRDTPVAAEWHESGALRQVPLLWFEWDLPGPATPLSSVCVADSILLGASTPAAVAAARAEAAVAVLLGRDSAPPWARGIRGLVAALQGAGELLHVATLAPRGEVRLRLDFHVLARAIPGWLARIGWPGDPAPLGAVLFHVAGPFERIGVQVELLPEVGGYLAFETREYRSQAQVEGSFPALCQGVGRVAGVSEARLAEVFAWPQVADDTALVHHAYVKMVRHPTAWEAKAYLGITRLRA